MSPALVELPTGNDFTQIPKKEVESLGNVAQNLTTGDAARQEVCIWRGCASARTEQSRGGGSRGSSTRLQPIASTFLISALCVNIFATFIFLFPLAMSLFVCFKKIEYISENCDMINVH